jgi:glycosyltransferase involved in cell wall biosynthesis
MRVCMLAYALYETDTRILQYAQALAARGDQVEVISLRTPGQPAQGLVNGIPVRRIQERGYTEKGKISFLLRILRFFCKSLALLTWRQFRRPYDLIHVHSVPDFLVFAALLPRLLGTKIILDIHDLLPEFYASKFGVSDKSLTFRLLLWEERLSCRFAHRVIAANHLWVQKLESRSVPPAKLSVFLNYPDTALFQPREKQGSGGKFLILFPGSLNWHQGLDVAIRAFHHIADQVPEAEFHIYGDGGAKEDLIQLVERLRLQERVIFHGWLPVPQIASLMAQADLAVVPKRKDSFGDQAFSTKTLEFMCLGVPLVLSDTTIDRHYFNDSVVRFFRSGDEQDLAQAMLQMIEDRELRERLAGNALEFVRAFDWNRKKLEYFELVDSLAGSRRPDTRPPV